MRRSALMAFLLVVVLAQTAHARVPPSLLKGEGEQEVASKYRVTKKRLKAEGYRKNLFGLEMGYLKEGFELEPGKTVYVAPVKNLAREETRGLVDALADATRKQVVDLLEETELFSKVTTRDKKADYSLEIYVMEVETLFNIWASSSRCVWGVNLYDAKRNLLMAGYDKVSSDIYSKDVEFLISQIPRRTILFICRGNPEFDAEYKKLMRTRKIDWRIWER